MAAQKLSIKFATRIRRIMAFNIEQKKEKEKAKKERLSGAASNMELNNDTSTQGSSVLLLFSS